MMNNQHPDGVSRRNFLRFAGVTVAAAAATGGGAAFLKRYEKAPVISTGASGAPVYPTAAPYTGAAPIVSDIIPTLPAAAPDDLYAQLAASQAEVMQLRAANDQLTRDLESLRAADRDGRSARDTMALELDDARLRLGVLGGLLALYQQLDEADLGEILEGGLDAVGETLAGLLDGVPSLSAGLDAGTLALGEVEAHIPLLDSGRSWLDAQSAKLDGFYGEVQARLQQAVERAGDFLEVLGEWFARVQRWLPFNMGEKSLAVMNALTSLLAETPGTISGMNANLAQPLDAWLGRVEGEPALTRKLVKPMREEVIGRARAAVEQTNAVATTYEGHLAAPARAALANRQTLRQRIAEYRAQHQI